MTYCMLVSHLEEVGELTSTNWNFQSFLKWSRGKAVQNANIAGKWQKLKSFRADSNIYLFFSQNPGAKRRLVRKIIIYDHGELKTLTFPFWTHTITNANTRSLMVQPLVGLVFFQCFLVFSQNGYETDHSRDFCVNKVLNNYAGWSSQMVSSARGQLSSFARLK